MLGIVVWDLKAGEAIDKEIEKQMFGKCLLGHAKTVGHKGIFNKLR